MILDAVDLLIQYFLTSGSRAYKMSIRKAQLAPTVVVKLYAVFRKMEEQAGAELGQAQLKLELELSFT